LVRRKGKSDQPSPTYQRTLELRSGETYNFRALRPGDSSYQQPLSRFFSSLVLETDHFSGSVDYYYQPYIPINDNQSRHILSGGLSWILERGLHDGILQYDRSFTLGYSYYKQLGADTINLQASS